MKHENESSQNPVGDSAKASRKKSHPFWQCFWLTFLVLSLWYAWHSFYVPSNDVTWAEDIASAREVSAEDAKPMMLFFTAEWCVPCRIMKRDVFADPEVMTAINANVVPVMIYDGDPGAIETAQQYNVGSTPTTIFTNAQGEVLDYAVGGVGKDKFLEMLKNLDSKKS